MNVVRELSNRIDVVLSAFLEADAERIVLAGIADYPNVGDSAITLGQLSYLRRLYPHANIAGLTSNLNRGHSLLHSADIIFLQGGGNFGDLWPNHHELRLHILETFNDKRIVQFPQSLNFTSDAVLRRTQAAICNAKKFTLLVRDQKSLTFAKAHFNCEILLCPDIAFRLGHISSENPRFDFACLLRTDKEMLESKSEALAHLLRASGATFVISDWLKNGLLENANYYASVALSRSSEVLATKTLPLLELYAHSRLRHGLTFLGSGRSVVTDRLHGYILSLLLGRRCYVFDSFDGKVRSFHETWLASATSAVFLEKGADLGAALSEPVSGFTA